MSKKPVDITPADSQGYDEIYREWFTCPKCGTRVTRDFDYCSGCGRPLRHIQEEKKPSEAE